MTTAQAHHHVEPVAEGVELDITEVELRLRSKTSAPIYVNTAFFYSQFAGWMRLPGLETDVGPAATSDGSQVHLFAKKADGTIWVTSAPQEWALDVWQQLPGETNLPLAAASLAGKVFAFHVGTDFDVYFATAPSPSIGGGGPIQLSFAPWQPLPGRAPWQGTDIAVTAAQLSPGVLAVFARNRQDKLIYCNQWTTGERRFGGWGLFPGANIQTDGLAAAYALTLGDPYPIWLALGSGATSTTLFRRTRDWSPIGTSITAPAVTTVDRSLSQLAVFAVDTTNILNVLWAQV